MNPKYLTYCKFNYNDTPPLIINRRKNSKPKHKPITKGSNTMKNIARKLVTLFFAICAGFAEVLAEIFDHNGMKRKQAEQTRSYIENQNPEERAGRLIPSLAPEANLLEEVFGIQAAKEQQNDIRDHVENNEPEVIAARLVC